ncbi:MAG: hypothetical protein E6G60_08445 [Actinobacteria bacterium]|nr:MAG: hypothetical protein E6G60_08445 [Actinomycetota bacterium]
MTTVQYVAAAGLALIVFVMLANFVVFLYARGAVRAALDEGARAGSRADASAAACESRARAVLHDLLGGALGAGVRVSCIDFFNVMTSRADVTLRGWLPGIVPDWTFQLTGRALKEHAP